MKNSQSGGGIGVRSGMLNVGIDIIPNPCKRTDCLSLSYGFESRPDYKQFLTNLLTLFIWKFDKHVLTLQNINNQLKLIKLWKIYFAKHSLN